MPRSQRILITAFRPFQGRSANGSATLLRWLRSRAPRESFHSSILPVDWVQAPLQLRRLLSRHRPRLVLSLGEGHPDRLAWECQAVNFQSGTDEAARTRMPSPIHEGAVPVLRSLLPHPPLQQAHSSACPFVRSEDAGTFLCNRLLWEALHHTAGQACFLHLPPQGQLTDSEYTHTHGAFLIDLLKAL